MFHDLTYRYYYVLALRFFSSSVATVCSRRRNNPFTDSQSDWQIKNGESHTKSVFEFKSWKP